MSLSPSSDPLAPPAADRHLKDYLNILRRRKTVFLQVFVLVLAVGVVVTFLSSPVYRTEATLVVPRVTAQINMVDVSNAIGDLLQRTAPDSMNTQIQILQSATFQAAARKRAKIRPLPGIAPPVVRVEPAEGGSDVIRITAEGGSPIQLRDLVQGMIDLHLEQTRQNQRGSLDEVVQRVREEKTKAEQRLRNAEARLVQFRKTHRVVQLSTEQEMRVREYTDLQAKQREAQSNINVIKAQIADLQARLAQEPLELKERTKRENPDWVKLQERLAAARAERGEASALYPEGSSRLRALDEKVQALEALLAKTPQEYEVETSRPNPRRASLQTMLYELESKLLGYQAEYNAATAKLASKRFLVDDLGPWEVRQKALERELEAAQAAYQGLDKQLRDLQIRQNSPLVQVRVLDPPQVPRTPIAPKKATNLMLAAVLALCLGAGMAFLQEYLDDRVNSPEDIERISALPALGHVPLIEPGQPRLVKALPANSHVAESYRALRSSIGFAGIDAPIRRLQVTSAQKGEGKTVTSVNLATAMAMDGKKVILVDADLRRPSIHRVLGVPGTPGLCEVLVGLRSVEQALQPTEIENLTILPAGPVPPNPAELLGSRAFDRVLEELEARADIVLVDSPPCVPVTDPLIIAARMDGVVLVIHTGHTKKAAVKHVEQLLSRARARIIGCVFNRVQQDRGGYYYYYGDGYYAETAERGARYRRNGRHSKGRAPELTAGSAAARGSRSDEEEA